MIGLQEVDSGQLRALRVLETLGYQLRHTRKAGENAAEGVAILWRHERFELVRPVWELKLSGPLDQLIGLDPSTRAELQRQQLAATVLSKVTTVAQLLLLRDKQEGELVLVSNTHLWYHPAGNHIRILQLHMLLTEIRRIVDEVEGCDQAAVVVLGDLNARKGSYDPQNAGLLPQGAYRLVSDGEINVDDHDWKHSDYDWDTDGVNEVCANNEERQLHLCLELPLPLFDPNAHIPVSNFTVAFKECLDYTLLDARGALEVDQLMTAPSREELEEETALPSTHFASDHIPIAIDVRYRAQCDLDD